MIRGVSLRELYVRCAPIHRFLGFSFPTRCLHSPRKAGQRHLSIASLAVAGFSTSGRLAASTLRNEAKASSVALRIADSLPRASPWGLVLSAPVWLHVGHLFDILIMSQINRGASLDLAHRIHAIAPTIFFIENEMTIRAYQLIVYQKNYTDNEKVFYPLKSKMKEPEYWASPATAK